MPGAMLPATPGLAGMGYGQVRDAYLCPAKAVKVHHTHAGQVSISLPWLPHLSHKNI